MKPKLGKLPQQIGILRTNALPMAPSLTSAVGRGDATPRMRGRKLMERNARWLRQHPLCVACEAKGLVAAAQEVDHREPLWSGGADDETNLQGLCRDCHQEKTAAEAADRARNS